MVPRDDGFCEVRGVPPTPASHLPCLAFPFGRAEPAAASSFQRQVLLCSVEFSKVFESASGQILEIS